MISRREFVGAVPVWLALARAEALAQGRRSLLGVWSGAVTPDSATLKVLAEPGVPITLELAAEAAPSPPQTRETDADGVASFVLRALQPRTRYRYTVRAPGEPALDGTFRTFADGPFSFRIVFASCAATGSASPVFTAMRQLQPDLFIHMGDLHYRNISRNQMDLFRQAYARVLLSQTQSALFRAVPIAYTWDDHDYGPNNSDRTSPSRLAALSSYRRFVPHYPLVDGDQAPICQTFVIGRVRFVMTDARSARSPESLPETERTMLGGDQLAWLEQQLETARSAPLVVLVNTVPWITKRKESTGDGWARYARERRHIADLIVRFGLTERLVMLSGDAHMLALDDGTHSQVLDAARGAAARVRRGPCRPDGSTADQERWTLFASRSGAERAVRNAGRHRRWQPGDGEDSGHAGQREGAWDGVGGDAGADKGHQCGQIVYK